MKKISLIMAIGVATAFMYSCNNSGNNDASKDPVVAAKDSNDTKEDKKVLGVDEADSKFLVFAADAGMTEIQAAELANAQKVSAKTKEFAAMMIKDHTAAGNEVKALAGTKNISLPADIGDDHKKAITNLGDKKPADFEKAYFEMMVDDHQKVVDKFKDASENCKDSDIKAFATKTLPTLQMHLDHAKMMKEGTKK